MIGRSAIASRSIAAAARREVPVSGRAVVIAGSQDAGRPVASEAVRVLGANVERVER